MSRKVEFSQTKLYAGAVGERGKSLSSEITLAGSATQGFLSIERCETLHEILRLCL